MVTKRPKIVIIGAGMAGITAAQKLYTTPGARELFDLCIVEGGERIGGRINTAEFGGDRIEMGATWIHGIGGSPIYEIAQKIKSLESEKPWECMDGLIEEKVSMAETRAESGFVLNTSIVEPISSLFEKLMSIAQCKVVEEGRQNGDLGVSKISSIGSFLKLGLDQYWASKEKEIANGVEVFGNWTKKMLEEAIFAIYENTQRTYTGAGDLFNLDLAAESEYRMFPGDEITIPRGYITIVESLASVLPSGLIQFGRKVVKIEWEPNGHQCFGSNIDQSCLSNSNPVKLHFSDGSVIQADHVILTVSLGVLKSGIREESSFFSPSLPNLKKEAISRLGYGVVNKLFLQLSQKEEKTSTFPFLQLAFHKSDSEFRCKKIPWWMRRTAAFYPIYTNSNVLLSWFAGKEALELETLTDDEIIDGVSTIISSFTLNSKPNSNEFSKILKSKWGTDPLFQGSYSYVAVGSSGEDFDSLAMPLPIIQKEQHKEGEEKEEEEDQNNVCESKPLPLQILFAGEATHRTHYSTTHGAYFSGLREANRLLQHYHLGKDIANNI